MRNLLLFAAIGAFVTIPATAPAGSDCPQRWYFPFFLAQKEPQGYSIRFADPVKVRRDLNLGGSSDRAYAAANQLPPNRASIIPTTEYLSQEAAAVAFYLGRVDVRTPISLDALWRGPDSLSCLRSLAQAAGLDVVVPQPGFWLVGAPDLLVSNAIEVVAYPIDTTLPLLGSETAVGALERALLAQLPVRDVGSHVLVGIGYYWVPGEPNTLLVVATHGANTNPSDGDNLEVVAYKVRVHTRGGRIDVECVWKHWMDLWGPLLPGIQEDFDGDGLQDFYFQEAGDRDKPDVILSGADGSTIARVSGESLAVQKSGNGPRLFAFRSLWGQPKPGGHAAVWRYSKQSKQMEFAQPQLKPQGGNGSGAAQFRRHGEEPGDVLAEALGGSEAVRVYGLPGFWSNGVEGGEYVTVHCSPVWGWFVNRNLKRTLDNPPPRGLPVHVVFRYLSPGYLEERAKEKVSQQR